MSLAEPIHVLMQRLSAVLTSRASAEVPQLVDSGRVQLMPVAADGRQQIVVTQETQRRWLIEHYQRETSILRSKPHFELPYAHLAWLGGEAASTLRPTLGAPYDVDRELGVEGFKARAIRYRANRGDKIPFAGSAVRLSSWSGDGLLTLSRADYQDQFVTNQTAIADAAFEQVVGTTQRSSDTTLREMDTVDARLLPFERSRLANTIGICGLVVTRDGFVILPQRNARVHVAQHLTSSSVSGVLEWTDALLDDFLLESIRQLKVQEAEPELGIDPLQVQAVPLALARELARAGKPQIFCLLLCSQSLDSLRERWAVHPQPAAEYCEICWSRLFSPESLNRDERQTAREMARRCLELSITFQAPLIDGVPLVFSDELRTLLLYSALRVADGRPVFPSSWRE